MRMSNSVTIKIPEDYLDLGYSLYGGDEVTIRPYLTVLVGCNGSGKSTFLKIVEDEIKGDEDTLVIKYNHLWDGRYAKDKALMRGDMETAARMFIASEGEAMKANLGELVASIGRQIHNSKARNIWILLDAMDSGFSIDNIVDMKDFFQFLFMQEKDRVIYVLIAANSFELARSERCLDVQNMVYTDFADYEEYRDFILGTREKRDELANGKDEEE